MSLIRNAILALAAVLAATGAHAQIAFVGAGQGSQAQVQFVDSSSATSSSGTITLAVPAGTQVGHFMLAQVAVRGGAPETFGAPAGWTEIGAGTHVAGSGGNSLKHRVYYRFATAGDLGGNASWTFSGNTATGGISSYRNVDTASPIDAQSSDGYATNGTSIGASGVTTTVDGAMLVALYAVNGDTGFTAPGGFTPRYSQNNGTQIDITAADLVQATAGASGTQTATLSTTENRRAARLIALTPLSGVAVPVPGGTAAGHVMIASIAARPCSGTSGNPCTTTITPPAGWTLVNSFDQTTGGGTGGYGNILYVYRRVATGAEPLVYAWALGGTPANNGAVGGIITFSGVDTASPIVAEAGQVTPNATSHTAPGINTGAVANTMLVASHAANSSTTWSSVEGMTSAVDGASLPVPDGLGVALGVFYQAQGAAGATGTRTAQYSSGAASDTGAAHLLALRPLAATIQVTLAGSVDNLSAGSIFLSGTRGGAPEAVNTATNFGNATITTAITTLTNNAWLVDVAGSGNAGTFSSPGAQTERWDTSASSATAVSSTKPVPSAGASSMQQTHSTTSNRTAHAVAAFAPSGAIAFVSAASANANSSATLSWSHSVPASGKLIVGIGIEAASDPCPGASTVSSVTHNGVPLTRVATVDASSSGFCQRVEIWYLDFGALADHLAFSHTGSGVACLDHTITLTAHDAAHGAVDAGARTVNLSTSNAKGTWTGIVSGGGLLSDPTPGDGAATYTFAGGSTQAQLAFRYASLAATAESFDFNASGGGISETSGTASGSDDPPFTMTQAGFRFLNVSDGNTTIPAQISGKSSNTGFGAKTIRIQAIDTDTQTGACAALFASQTRSVDLGAECNSPASCAGRQVSVNAANIATGNDNGGGGAAAYTGVALAFNASSEADVAIAYPDAGQISLHARYDLDPGVAGFEALGSSNAFVVRPFGLAFPGINHSSTAAGSLIGAAGDNFAMTVQAYQWAAGEDGDADGVPDAGANITDNGTVPNFAATATVGVSANLPGAAPGALSRGAGCANPASVAMTAGSGAAADWCYSEAGNVLLTADVANYLAAGVDITGNSGLDGDAAGGYVGRFKPKHFVVTGAPTLTNRAALACASAFTYMNEGLRLGFTLEARNAQNVLTQNYTGAYAKLNLALMSSLGIGARSGGTNLTGRVDNALAPGGSFANGVASLTAVTGIRRASPDNPDGPYPAAQFGIAPSDADGVQMQSFDLDVDGVGGNDHFAIAPATELRFGQLSLDNAYGPVSRPVPIPIETEYWNGSGFVTNALDSCTTLARANIALAFTGAVNPCETALTQATLAFSSGAATLTLAAPGPGNRGTVLLTPQLGTAAGTYCPSVGAGALATVASPAVYLIGRWNDAANPDGNPATSYDDKPPGQAGFGLYGSQPRNFIFFRENY